MKKIILLVISVFLFAYVQEKSVLSVAEGNTPSNAIKNALVLAIQQIYGVDIKAELNTLKYSKIVTINQNSNYLINQSFLKRIKTITKGKIENFEIIELSKTPNGYFVKLKVNFKIYKLNTNHRRNFAVFPFLGTDKKFSEILTNSFLAKLTQIRKFNVIDRSSTPYLLVEKIFNSPINSKKINSDYLFVGKIVDFEVNTEKIKNPLTDEIKYISYVKLLIDYKIFDSIGGILKYADRIKIYKKVNNTNLENIANKVASIITDKILFNVYPPIIIAKNDKFVTISIGGNIVKKGEILAVYKKGKKIYDNYTKEFLGYEERKVGIIKIMRVNPKTSIAIYKGNIEVGDIIRRLK